jgi:hypothetical protein
MRTPVLLILLAALLARASPGAGQSRESALREYRFVSEPGFLSATWVNPGASGFNRPVHLFGHITGERPEGGKWKLAQYLVGLQWEIVSLGYQHDEFQDDGSADTYTVSGGFAAGTNGFGVSYTWTNPGQTEGSWNAGWLIVSQNASAGIVWRDLGSPQVRDSTLHERLVGAATFRPSEGTFGFSLQLDYRTKLKNFNAFRVGGNLTVAKTFDLLALAQWNSDGDFDGFMIGGILRGQSVAASGVIGLESGGDAGTANAGLDFWQARQGGGNIE